jgi:hypothetical protein
MGGSDDWSHARRYDRLLDTAPGGSLLAELWTTLQSLDAYRGRTTLTDHGRGRTPKDWAEHDAGIPGCDDIWLAIIGPDTPALGEVRNYAPVTQSDIAATMLQYRGRLSEVQPAGVLPVPGSLKTAALTISARRRGDDQLAVEIRQIHLCRADLCR